MRVSISLELDVSDLNEDAIHDLVADMTYEMRSSRRLRDYSWDCNYNPEVGRPSG